MAPRKPQPSPAVIIPQPALKSCLVNLPASLVALLESSNTYAQNVVVELIYQRALSPHKNDAKENGTKLVPTSAYVGWTGMRSNSSAATGTPSFFRARQDQQQQQQATVEIDPVFARRVLGLADAQRVGVVLHLDPPLARSVNVEPLTPADWEMIELSAHFLEANFLSQVRALPNPAYRQGAEAAVRHHQHSVTLHLSPTSTVTIAVVAVEPAHNGSPFVKIAADAEIIVAPKELKPVHKQLVRDSSVASRRSVASAARRKAPRDMPFRASLALRGVARSLPCDAFDPRGCHESLLDKGLRVWLHPSLLLEKPLKGLDYVAVSIIKPPGLMEKPDPQKEANQTEKPSTKVVARLLPWHDAYDMQHVALSSLLCKCLSTGEFVGGLVRLQPAPNPFDPITLKPKEPTQKLALSVIPFISDGATLPNGLRFGGTKTDKDQSLNVLTHVFADGNALFHGPITDGMLLPPVEPIWHGGILRVQPPMPSAEPDTHLLWLNGLPKSLPIEIQPEVQPPTYALKGWSPGEPLPNQEPSLVGLDSILSQVLATLGNGSPVLLTGGLGSGKTTLSHLVAHRLRSELLFHVIYLPCRAKFSGEQRLSNIQDALFNAFAAASWGARSGGRSLVLLDDLETICFAETELGEGGDNVRSKNLSAALSAVIKLHCSKSSGVVLLATAQSKDALNKALVSTHVVDDAFNLPAPNKELRRKILEHILQSALPTQRDAYDSPVDSPLRPVSPSNQSTSTSSNTHETPGYAVSPTLDLLDIAGQTDGYMPGDLAVLIRRAQSECIIRNVAQDADATEQLTITPADFTAASKGFTPASLRNISLQTLAVKWSSIGGLSQTRQILLETLQYPTTYAPIFAKSSLRLRSGILLYGYPGCGKTLLASAIASECGLNFIAVKGPEILNKYIGASEKAVRDLFERAQAAKPCVLFFDEFDSIAPKRGHDSTGVTDRVVNQLLTQMDGAEGLDGGVYVLAATSRPDLIDPALLRPGRLDKAVLCDMPGLDDRLDILRAVARRLQVDERELGAAQWRDVAARTAGFSGADLQALLYNAHLEAVHELLQGEEDAARNSGSSSGLVRTSNSIVPVPPFDVWRMSESNVAHAADISAAERRGIAAKLQDMHLAQRQKKKKKERGQQPKHRRLKAAAGSSGEESGGNDSDDAIYNRAQSPAARRKSGQVTPKAAAATTAASGEPTVMWRHIATSLAATRPSISALERHRLARIYREFVSGRSGDLPNGDGGSEIGARTSLM